MSALQATNVADPLILSLIDLSIECFEKTKRNQGLMPLQSLRTFTILHNACPKGSGGGTSTSSSASNKGAPTTSLNEVNVSRSQSHSPTRNQPTRRSTSPSKVSMNSLMDNLSSCHIVRMTEDENCLQWTHGHDKDIQIITLGLAELGVHLHVIISFYTFSGYTSHLWKR